MKDATLCYIERNGQYLMMLRNKKQNDPNEGKWIGVGGKLEEGEIPLEAAKRELLEETGYRPLEMIHLGDSYPTPGYSSEVIHLYYCPEAVKEERHLDKDENIDLIYLSLEEIEKLIADNIIKDSKTVAAISLYKLKMINR